VLIAVLVVLSLAFGGFQKGTKVGGAPHLRVTVSPAALIG